MKSQGIVGVSLMVQVSNKRDNTSCYFTIVRLLNCIFLSFRLDKQRIQNFKWLPMSSVNFYIKVSKLILIYYI